MAATKRAIPKRCFREVWVKPGTQSDWFLSLLWIIIHTYSMSTLSAHRVLIMQGPSSYPPPSCFKRTGASSWRVERWHA